MIDEGGWTAHHIAASRNQIDVAKLVLQWGANVKTQDVTGLSPLHVAALSKTTKVARILLDTGADIKMKDIFNETPFDGARGELKLLLKELQVSVP